MKIDADVIVVGGGPAGAAAARALATRGARTLVLERAPMPRDKVCGDLLGTEAVATVRRLGFSADVYAGATVLEGAILVGPTGSTYGATRTTRRTTATDAARVITRARFDAALLAQSERAGALVRYERVRDVSYDRDEMLATVRTDRASYRAHVAIGADGWGSLVARTLDAGAPPDRNVAYAVRAYASGVAGLAGRMHFFINPARDGYAWIFPLGAGGANIGLGFIKSEGRFDLHAAFERFRTPGSPAYRFLRDATFAQLAAWPIPIGARAMRRSGPGLLLAGDAAFLASPLSGSGIHHALASGDAAGRYAVRVLAGDRGAYAAYERWIARRLATRLRGEAFAHRAFGTEATVDRYAALSRLPGGGALLSRAMLALG